MAQFRAKSGHSAGSDLREALLLTPTGVSGVRLLQFQRAQINSLRGISPYMMLAQITTTSLIVVTLNSNFEDPLLLLWATSLFLYAGVMTLKWVRGGRNKTNFTQKQKMLHYQKVIPRAVWSATTLGILWGALPAFFFVEAAPTQQLIIAGVLAGMTLGGVAALAVIPRAALGYILGCCLPVQLTLGIFVQNALSQEALIVLALLMLVLMFTAISTTVRIYSTFRNSVLANIELERKNQLVGLLLKEFEEHGSDWIWETDHRGLLTYVSKRMCDVTGKSKRELLRQTISFSAGHTSEGAAEHKALNRLLNTRRPFNGFVVPAEISGETRWWSITAKPVFDENGRFTGYRGVTSDITDAKRSEIALSRAKQAAEEASAAKSRFLASMSHELRTPLNAILGFSEMIEGEFLGEIENKSYVNYARDIHDAGKHLLNVINDILDIAMIEADRMRLEDEIIAPGELIDTATRICTQLANQKAIELRVDDVAKGITLRGDRKRLTQVLINLIGNAIKYSPPRSTITLFAEPQLDGGLSTCVRDQGPSIPADKLRTIFDPFTRLENSATKAQGGAGLGLSIARAIAREHKGDVVLQSAEGVGTTAKLNLPPQRCSVAPMLNAS